MDVDSSKVKYGVRAYTESGKEYTLDFATTGISWEEQEGQLAVKATLTVAAEATVQKESVLSFMKLNRRIAVFADWGSGYQKVFEGIIWEWDYTHGAQKDLKVIAYDPMVKLQQSKEHYYFSAGMDTKAIISTICKDAGVPLNYKWPYTIKHEKKVFRQNTLSDMILELLEEVRKQKNKKYVTLYRDGKLEINSYGTNKDMFKFNGFNTVSTQDKLTMDKLVTKVKILGKADDEGRSSVEGVINGDLSFGTLQEIVIRDSDKELGAAKQEAQTILNDYGKPEETLMATAPDIPFIRKGDAVEFEAGNIIGTCHVLGVSHNASSRQMTMTLLRISGSQVTNGGLKEHDDKDDDTAEFKVGDSVILNGPVYVDSYGNGRGRTFTDYKSTITYTAPTDRNCPYCVGSVGWVYPNTIKLA